MPRKRAVVRWEGRLGVWPHVVWYGERPERRGVCYTRTWSPATGNWKWQSCRTRVRDAQGVLNAEAQARVLEIAKRRHDLLTGKVSLSAIEDLPPVTIGDAWALITGDGGRYPTKTPYRDELEAGINQAAKVLGSGFAWMHMDEVAFTRVIRDKVKAARAKGFTGFRIGVQTGTAVIIIMNLLRDLKRLPAGVAIPGGKRWRADLKRFVTDLSGGIEPEPARPRHTADEVRAILAAAHKVDPRFALLIALGAEIRLGQVRRARRSSIDRDRGIFRSPGRGGKRGAVVELTAGQRAAVDRALAGYLAPLEAACADYPLFPQGQLARDGEQLVASVERHASADPVDKRTVNEWWRAAETVAQVPHMKGRAGYGAKRRLVDEAIAAGISPEALKEHGGWTTDRMPQTVYRDQQVGKARHEAAEVRARIRGENVSESYPATPTSETTDAN